MGAGKVRSNSSYVTDQVPGANGASDNCYVQYAWEDRGLFPSAHHQNTVNWQEDIGSHKIIFKTLRDDLVRPNNSTDEHQKFTK